MHGSGRMLNIHPSLLPAFPGLDTHARALAAGVKLHGCTVHLVTQTMDEGPILAQAAVPVLPGDTAETLAARVLVQEHRIYPMALRCFVAGAGGEAPPADAALVNCSDGYRIRSTHPTAVMTARRRSSPRSAPRRMGRAAAKPITSTQHQRWQPARGQSDRIKGRHARESGHPARASQGDLGSRLRGNDSLKKLKSPHAIARAARGCPIPLRCNRTQADQSSQPRPHVRTQPRRPPADAGRDAGSLPRRPSELLERLHQIHALVGDLRSCCCWC